jgi:hypothetical protein
VGRLANDIQEVSLIVSMMKKPSTIDRMSVVN